MKGDNQTGKKKPENVFFGNVEIYFFEFDVSENKNDCKQHSEPYQWQGM